MGTGGGLLDGVGCVDFGKIHKKKKRVGGLI